MPQRPPLQQLTIGSPPLMAELSASVAGVPLVVLVHSDLASRSDPAHSCIAGCLQSQGFATLTLSLRLAREEVLGAPPLHKGAASARLEAALAWIVQRRHLARRRIGLFGFGAAAPACVTVARAQAHCVDTLVLLDGQFDPDYAVLDALPQPGLLLVGARDDVAEVQAHRALSSLNGASRLQMLPCVTQPLAEAGACDIVAYRAARWLAERLRDAVRTPTATPAAKSAPTSPSIRNSLADRPAAAD